MRGNKWIGADHPRRKGERAWEARRVLSSFHALSRRLARGRHPQRRERRGALSLGETKFRWMDENYPERKVV